MTELQLLRALEIAATNLSAEVRDLVDTGHLKRTDMSLTPLLSALREYDRLQKQWETLRFGGES